MRISSLQFELSNRLKETSRAIARSLERLSTGKRVNHPRDDVAAFAQISQWSSRIRGLQQAQLNVNIGKGLLETASASVSSLTDIVQAMREISLEASNGGLTIEQRQSLQEELVLLKEQFDQIVDSTSFNGMNLLDSSQSSIQLQIGANADDNLQLQLEDLRSSQVFRKLVPTGQFETASSTVISGSPERVAVGDLNGDGFMDVVAPTGSGYTGMDILLGRGDGTFVVEKNTDTSANVQSVELGDVNGDGTLDLISADRNDDTVSLYIGNGDGTFQTRTTLAQADFVYQVHFGDVNGDGVLDILAGLVIGSTTAISVQLGNGDGTFQTAVTTAAAGGSGAWRDFQVGDFNNDGADDVILGSGAFGANNVQMFISGGDGSFTIPYSNSTAAFEPSAIGVGDIDGDGNLDFIAIQRASVGGTPNQVETYLGDGSGGFTVASTISMTEFAGAPVRVQLADVNSDGRLDFFSSHQTSGNGLWIGDGAGGFTLNTSFSGNNRAAVVEDFNNDGVLDLLYTNKTGNLLNVLLARTKTASALSDFSVLSETEAASLTAILDSSLERLVEAQSSLGSQLNRLDYTVSYLVGQENALQEARESAEEVDLILEMAELMRNQILQEAQIAAMSQVNLNLQLVVQLLSTKQ